MRLTALLDTTPLTETVPRVIDFAQLHRNVEAARVDATAVVATSVATSESVLFVEGGTLPPEDVGAGLDYVATRLSDEHVRASTAIPALFPAVHVSQPAPAQGWYLDGGARLNAPVRPALSAYRRKSLGSSAIGVARGWGDGVGAQTSAAMSRTPPAKSSASTGVPLNQG